MGRLRPDCKTHRLRFVALSAGLLAALACALATAAPPAAPAKTLSTAIAPQPLESAIEKFQELTGINVSWPPHLDASALHSQGAAAGLPPQEALKQLLHGTGLSFTPISARIMGLYVLPPPKAAPPPPQESPEIQEVLVQGIRWERQLTRQPVNVRLLDPQTLRDSGIKGLAEIGALIPGVDFGFFSSVGSGVYTDIIIRGVTDRHGSTTGLFFDDIPLPAARSNTFGRALTPYFDLAGIEILSGAQGPLLGADTQGGAVRFVTRQPDLETYSGFAHAEWAWTERGDPSYEVGAALGGPLVKDVLGFRLSAWYRSDGGYVDLVNPFACSTSGPCTIVDENSNALTSESFRAALTWQVSDIKITPALDYTSSRSGDSPAFYTYLSNPGAGQLYNGSLIPQPFNDSFWLGSLKVTDDLAWAELESVTAYYHRKGDLIVDDTESMKWGPLVPPGTPPIGWGNPLGPAFPVSYSNLVATYTQLRQDMFSQELRLVSPIRKEALTWNAGISYVNTRDTEAYRVVGEFIPRFGSPLDLAASTTTVPQRLAAFGQVSRTFGRTTVRAALRIEHDQYESNTPPSVGIPPYPLAFHGTASATLGIPAFSVFYTPEGEERLYYASVSKGYSPAGVDAALPTCFQPAQPYPTDTLWSYELGAKFGLIEERPYLHLALFSSRWDNGPEVITNCLVTHIPGSAISRGFELKTGTHFGNLRAALEVTYIDAFYTDTLTAGNGQVFVNRGDALGTPPLVASPWNVLATLEQSFTVRGELEARLRAEDAFHSHNDGPFYTGNPGASLYATYAPGLTGDPATNLLNLRATLDLTHAGWVSQAQRLEVALFMNNVFDAQPTLLKRNKGVDESTLYYATTFRPRAVGLTGTWQF
jgi:outer membrane receptor for Fe3+-dicitrate